MPRCSARIRLMRFAGTPIASARALALMSIGRRYSSRRISPGWMGRMALRGMGAFLLVIVDDFDVLGSARRPAEADAELVVDTDGVLAGAVGDQGFEPVVGGRAQVVESGRGVEHDELALDDVAEVAEATRRAALEDGLRLGAPERPDRHAFNVAIVCCTSSVQQSR